MGERRRFDRNRISKGVGDWEIFVFNRPQGKGFGWGFVVSLDSQGKKEALKRSEPVWGIRKRHMVKDLPQPYVFMLLPCKAKDRPHPRCEERMEIQTMATLGSLVVNH